MSNNLGVMHLSLEFRLSQLNDVLEKQNGTVFHVGIDVHKNSYHVAFLGDTGKSSTFVCSAAPEEVINHFNRFDGKIAQVVYECGPTGFELARVLNEAGYNVLVVAPSRVPRPVTEGAKTDRLDCIRLAQYSANGMLKSVAVPSRDQEAQRSLIRRRHDVLDSIRKVKQRIRSHLLYLSIKEPIGLEHWSDQSVKALLKLPMPPGAKDTLKSLVRELMFLKNERQRLEKQIRDICSQERLGSTYECLQTAPGVGPITAATFQLELFDPGRFKTGDQVASYLGLAPCVRQSGESKGRSRLRPVGQKRLRSLLVEAAWCLCRKDEQAGAKYRRLVSKTNVPQKAIVAIARDLAVILWRLSLEQRAYQLRPVAA
jgi:transposase